MADRTTARAKPILRILAAPEAHWVGDGFPVRSLFSYHDSGTELSPFLLLDYAEPQTFPPTEKRLGVGAHPHRGFETVTIVYAGEVEHRDSSGGGGRIGPGDVQWMTAAAGLIHEEFHGREFARQGGPFEMVQLWVNLPARHKLAPPRYQSLLDAAIPTVNLGDGAGSVPVVAGEGAGSMQVVAGEGAGSMQVVAGEGAGSLRVVAGEFGGRKGPAETFTPIHVWDLRLERGTTLAVPEGFTTVLVVLRGPLRVNGSEPLDSATCVVFERTGTELRLESSGGAKALLLAGEPIAEPIAGYGPFVMNTQAEIRQAIQDFQTGKMGRLA